MKILKNDSLRNNMNNKKRCIISLLVAFIIAFIPMASGKIYYMEADDFLMNLISKGGFGNGPDSYLIYMNIFVGWILKLLYKLFPATDWFAYLYFAVIVSAFSALSFILWRISRRGYILFITSFLELAVILNLTYTVLAYLCIGVSLVYLLNIKHARLRKSRRLFFADILITVCLFFTGVLLRANITVLLSTLICMAPLFLFNIKNLKCKSVICVIIVMCAGFIVLTLGNKLAYGRTSLWKEYMSYNTARSEVLDYPALDYTANKEVFDRHGISQNDWNCMYSWIIADKEVFSEEALHDIFNSNTGRYNTDIPDIIVRMFKQKYNYIFLIGVILSAFIAGKRERRYIVFQALTTYAVIASLYFRNRPVLRVMLPIYIAGLIAELYIALSTAEKRKTGRVYALAVTCFILCLSSVLIYGNICRDREYGSRNESFMQLYDYINNNSDTLYAASAGIVNPLLYNFPVFKAGSLVSAENIIKLGSWDIYSSRYYSQIRRYGITYEDRLLIAMAQEDKIQFITNDSGSEYEMIISYIEEHTDREVSGTLVRSFPDAGINIYKLKIN